MASYRTENNIKVDMQDIRDVHEPELYGMRYAIHVERSRFWPRNSRTPFTTEGALRGYHKYGVSHSPLCSSLLNSLGIDSCYQLRKGPFFIPRYTLSSMSTAMYFSIPGIFLSVIGLKNYGTLHSPRAGFGMTRKLSVSKILQPLVYLLSATLALASPL